MTKKPSYVELENALRESEERYHSVVDNIGVGISTISPKMEILSLNKQMRDWFPEIDISNKPICYKSFNNPPRQENCTYCPTAKTLNDGMPHESVISMPSGDSIINYRIIATPIKNREGKVVGAIETVEDVTEKLHAEEALRESEERLQMSLSAGRLAWYDLNIQTGKATVSPEYPPLIGYEPEDFDASLQNWLDNIHSDDRQAVLNVYQNCLVTGAPTTMEYRRRMKDGNWRWLSSMGQVTAYDDDKKPLRMVGTHADITERKQAEDELKKIAEVLLNSEEKYRRLVESLERDYIIYSHDIQGVFTYLSPSITNVLGYTQADFMGHYTEYITDSPINKDVEEHTNAGLRGEKQLPYEAEFWHKDGSRRHLRTTEVPVFDDNGNVLGIEGIVQDITELKQAEAEREELIKKLHEALHKIKTLRGIIPICMHCKGIRDDNGYWNILEKYITEHSEANFSHGICPECFKKEMEKINAYEEEI